MSSRSPTPAIHYLGFSLGAKVGWGVAAWAQDRVASVALIGGEPEASEEISGEFVELFEQGMDGGDLELATLDGADHMASFLSDHARHAYPSKDIAGRRSSRASPRLVCRVSASRAGRMQEIGSYPSSIRTRGR